MPKAQVEYVQIESTVRQGLEKMRFHGFSAIPVIDKDGKYRGTVTEGDFLWALYNDGEPDLKKLEKRELKSIMRKRYNAIRAGASIDEILSTAINQNFVPVVDDRDMFIGIITRKAIIQYLATVETELPDAAPEAATEAATEAPQLNSPSAS